MVLLKAYHCHSCSSICKETADFCAGICVECGKLTCGSCAREEQKATKCAVSEKNCEYTTLNLVLFHFLHKFPPDDELKLLNYGKWCPVWCKCSARFATERICFIDRSSNCCTKCRPADKLVKDPPIDTYMSIIDELRGYFCDQDCIDTKRKGLQLQLEHFKCETCKTRLDHPVHLSTTGDLICKKCTEKSTTSYCARKGNLSFLSVFLIYIPDVDDLKLLTYSKWTPLRCELCSTLFSTNVLQLPRFHLGCYKLLCNQCNYKHSCNETSSASLQLTWVLDVDREFRSYFKNGGYDSSENHVKKSDVDENLPDLIPISSGNSDQLMSMISGFPKKVRCHDCARLKTPVKLRMCVDCKTSSHKIEEIATTLQTAFIQKENEKTLRKLAKWRESLNEGNKQIDVVSMKVVDNYNCLYSVAVRESDLGLLQAIREWGDIGQVQDSVGEFTGAQIKFRVNIEMLADALDEIVKAAKERCEDCALFVAPNDLRRCVDCEKSCLCFACLTKKHWGHKIEEIATTLQTAFIQKESEKTLQKLAKWRESLNEGSRQIDVVSMKVVDNYNWLYSVAVRESDLGLLQTIREWGDIGQVQDSVEEFTVAQIKFRVNIEMLTDALDEIVKAAKERYGELDTDETEAATSTC